MAVTLTRRFRKSYCPNPANYSESISSQFPEQRSHDVVRLLQILMLLSIFWGASAIVVGQTVGGAVLLKNDRMLVGRVESRGNLYTIAIAEDSRVSIPVDQVRHVAKDRLEIYQFKAGSTKRWDIGDHFQMTRWCLLNDLLDQAIVHYQEVTKIHADHPRVKQLGVELEKKLLEQPEFRDFLGLAPVNERKDRIEHRMDGVPAGGPVVSAGATLEHTAMNPEIASTFSSKIQPILLNRCSQAACHGVRSQNSLMLMEPYDRAYARISSQNLQSVLPHVSQDGSQLAPLLRYATTTHGIQREPAISLTESQLLAELGNWIKRVQNPVVPAVGTGSETANSKQVRPAHAPQFVPYSPVVSLIPVPQGENGLRQVPRQNTEFPAGDAPTMSEIDELDRQLSQLLGESNAAPSPPSSVPPSSRTTVPSPPQTTPNRTDPFDPEEFNQRYRQ